MNLQNYFRSIFRGFPHVMEKYCRWNVIYNRNIQLTVCQVVNFIHSSSYLVNPPTSCICIGCVSVLSSHFLCHFMCSVSFSSVCERLRLTCLFPPRLCNPPSRSEPHLDSRCPGNSPSKTALFLMAEWLSYFVCLCLCLLGAHIQVRHFFSLLLCINITWLRRGREYQ